MESNKHPDKNQDAGGKRIGLRLEDVRGANRALKAYEKWTNPQPTDH